MSNISFWLKKNSPTLIFGGTFALLISYFGYNTYEQSRFLTPVVAQTVNILSRNQRIKQLLGFPLSYKSTSKRSMSQRKDQTYYSFTVNGPRGTTDVQVTSLKKKAKDIYNYNKNKEKQEDVISKEKEQIFNKQAQLKSINEQIKKINSEIQKKKSIFRSNQNQPNRQQLKNKQITKIKLEEELKGLKHNLQLNIINHKKFKNEYYIPLDSDIYNEILSSGSTGKNLDNVIPEDLTLCKISQLSVQLPNKSRISIITEGKNLAEQGKSSFDLSNVNIPSYQTLNQKLKMDLGDLTKEQLSFYSKHKTDSMYQKYSVHRVLTAIILGSCFLFGYKAIKSRKIISVNNSVLTQIVSTKFIRNQKIKQLLKITNIKKLQISQTITGGMKKNQFDCSAQVKGISMGKVQFSGIFKQKTSEYQFKKFQFTYLADNQIKKIDLLN